MNAVFPYLMSKCRTITFYFLASMLITKPSTFNLKYIIMSTDIFAIPESPFVIINSRNKDIFKIY